MLSACFSFNFHPLMLASTDNFLFCNASNKCRKNDGDKKSKLFIKNNRQHSLYYSAKCFIDAVTYLYITSTVTYRGNEIIVVYSANGMCFRKRMFWLFYVRRHAEGVRSEWVLVVGIAHVQRWLTDVSARISGISNVISENGEQLWAKFGTE